MNNQVKNILFDFGGVILPEGDININEQLKKVFSYDNPNIEPVQVFNKYRGQLRNGRISEHEFIGFFLKYLNKRSYDENMLNELRFKMLNELKGYNGELVQFIQELRALGYKCSILSDTYKPLKSYILDAGLYSGFDEIFLSCDIGYSKKDCLSGNSSIFNYLKIHGITGDNSLLIDDREENCQLAQTQGFKTIKYVDTVQTKDKLNFLLSL